MPENAPPSISAVIPTFNRSEVVTRAIDSALAQTVMPIEIIVVDDGSTDGTPARLESLPALVRVLRQTNRGAASARNHGVRSCAGDWIAFLDSDDVWASTHLERIAAAIDGTDGQAVMYFSDVVWNGSTAWTKSAFTIRPPFALASDGAPWLLRPSHPCLMPGTVMRRETVLALGGFKEDMAVREDTHLFFRLGLGSPICAVSGVGAIAQGDTGRERLTGSVPMGTLAYNNRTLELYRDTIAAKPDLAARYRRVLRRRMGAAYVTRAGLLVRRRRFGRSIVALGHGAVLDPRGTASRFGRRMTGGRTSKI